MLLQELSTNFHNSCTFISLKYYKNFIAFEEKFEEEEEIIIT